MLHRTGDGDTSYCVSKAMLNMTVRLMFNELRPEGTPSGLSSRLGAILYVREKGGPGAL